ncbi:MAG: RES domain-containing protein [Candidatus Binataceae bacterium]
MLLQYAGDPLGKLRPIQAHRFNTAGGARILYLAEDHLTALHEIQAFGWPVSAVAIVPVQFDLKAVVDLRDSNVQKILRATAAELAFNFRSQTPPSPTQSLGDACAAFGRIDSLIFESPAMAGKANLAVMEIALLQLGSSLTVNDPANNLQDRLP